MKRFVAFVMLLVAISLYSCSLLGGKKDIDLNLIWDKISSETDLPIMQTPTSEKMAEYFPSFKPEDFKQYLFKVASQNIKAEEVILIQVKDDRDLDKAYSMIQKRIEDKQAYFKNYLDKPYDLVNNFILKTHDRYIIFAVSSDIDKIEQIFMGFVSDQEKY